MNKELKKIAEWSIKTAKAAGADECKASIDSQRFVEISYRNGKPENIKEASKKGLYLQIFANKRYSGQGTSDLRPGALKKFIDNAVATTKLLAEDPFRTLPDPRYYQGRKEINLEISDPEYEKLSAEKRHKIAKEVEASVIKTGGEKIISCIAMEYDNRFESLSMTNNGFVGYNQATVYYAGARVTAKGVGDRRPASSNYMGALNLKDLPPTEKIGKIAAERTLDLIGGKKIKTETLPIIIENRNVSRILGGLVGAMTGRSVQQKSSFLHDKKGEKFASEKLTLIDDPFIKGGLGSRLYDGDGFATKKRVMIEKGILKDFYVDWYYSRKLGWEPTTGGPSNMVIPPGKRSVKEIMKDLGRGILVTSFIGGNSNSTTGDASIGITGKLFEKGQPVQTVVEMNIADNHLKFWQKLTEVGNDPWIYSSWRMPSLVFTDVVVSGV